jgi:hypothetical protein
MCPHAVAGKSGSAQFSCLVDDLHPGREMIAKFAFRADRAGIISRTAIIEPCGLHLPVNSDEKHLDACDSHFVTANRMILTTPVDSLFPATPSRRIQSGVKVLAKALPE